jgi:hypothetical protein
MTIAPFEARKPLKASHLNAVIDAVNPSLPIKGAGNVVVTTSSGGSLITLFDNAIVGQIPHLGQIVSASYTDYRYQVKLLYNSPDSSHLDQDDEITLAIQQEAGADRTVTAINVSEYGTSTHSIPDGTVVLLFECSHDIPSNSSYAAQTRWWFSYNADRLVAADSNDTTAGTLDAKLDATVEASITAADAWIIKNVVDNKVVLNHNIKQEDNDTLNLSYIEEDGGGTGVHRVWPVTVGIDALGHIDYTMDEYGPYIDLTGPGAETDTSIESKWWKVTGTTSPGDKFYLSDTDYRGVPFEIMLAGIYNKTVAQSASEVWSVPNASGTTKHSYFGHSWNPANDAQLCDEFISASPNFEVTVYIEKGTGKLYVQVPALDSSYESQVRLTAVRYGAKKTTNDATIP